METEHDSVPLSSSIRQLASSKHVEYVVSLHGLERAVVLETPSVTVLLP